MSAQARKKQDDIATNDNYYLHAEELTRKRYRVVPIKCGEKRPIGTDWGKYIRGVNEVKEEVATRVYGQGTGVGILTGVIGEQCVIAMDNDITDEVISKEISQWLIDNIGKSPIRYGKFPKALIPYRYNSDGGRKKEIIKVGDKDGSVLGKVEILGTGQQFVAYHVHPETGMPYTWGYDIPPQEDLPEITEDHIRGLREFIRGKWPVLYKEGDHEAKAGESSGQNIPQLMANIISGVDYHDSIVNLSQQYRYSGMKEEDIINSIKGLMNLSQGKTEDPVRWQLRYDDIERIVSGAKEKPQVDVASLKYHLDDNPESSIPWPNGKLGRLADYFYDAAIYQYKEIAVISAIGMIAGICGRKFNISTTGLNVYLTFILRTGGGKEAFTLIGKLMNECKPGNMPALSFIGTGGWTSGKAIYNSFVNARSRLCILTEVGVLMSVKSGEPADVRRAMLNLYTRSGKHEYSSAKDYSDKDDGVASLRAVALSIIGESTADVLIQAFSRDNAAEAGDLGRQSIFRVLRDKPYMNHDHLNAQCPQDIKAKIGELIHLCSSVQAIDDPDAIDIIPISKDVQDDMRNFEKYITDAENDSAKRGDVVLSAVLSRAYLKALRFAGIATAINYDDARLRFEDWEWAKNMVQYEIDNVSHMFKDSCMGDYMEFLINIVSVKIIDFLQGNKKPKNMQTRHKSVTSKGYFSAYDIRQVLKSNKKLAAIADNPAHSRAPRDGLDKTLYQMVRDGLLYIVDKNDPIRPFVGDGEVYRITPEFGVKYGMK